MCVFRCIILGTVHTVHRCREQCSLPLQYIDYIEYLINKPQYNCVPILKTVTHTQHFCSPLVQLI